MYGVTIFDAVVRLERFQMIDHTPRIRIPVHELES